MFKNNRGALRWIYENSKPIMGSIVLLTVLGIIVSYVSVEFAMAARELLDVATGVSEKSFKICVMRIVILLLAEVALESFYNIYAVRVSSKNKNRLQKNLFASVIKSRGAKELAEISTLARIISEEIEYSADNTNAIKEIWL